MNAEITCLLQKVGRGRMLATTYDIAWAIRFGAQDRGLIDLLWIGAAFTRKKNLDGSWGAENYHSQVVSTLEAMLALQLGGRRWKNTQRSQRAWLHSKKSPTELH